MKKRIFLMVAILIAILGTVGIYYYNNTISIKVQSRSKKDVFFDVKYYDLSHNHVWNNDVYTE